MSTFVNNQTITSEHAVLLQEVPDCPHLLDYVKAVGSAIGSSHIHSIVKSDDKIKLYLKERKYVDYIIGAGVVLRGHHAKVEFATPPASHVLVLNVDPLVPDDLVVALLSPFGIFKSNVIHPNLSEDSAYCHIFSGERRVYMKLFDNIEIPDTLSVEYDGSDYDVTLKIENSSTESSSRISAVKSKTASVNPVQEGSHQATDSPESISRISANKSKAASVNPVREGSHQATDRKKDLPAECEESEFVEHAIKVEHESDDGMEQDDDLFELFSGVNDWDTLLSNDYGHEGDQSKARNKLSISNVCSVRPMQTSHVNHETSRNSA